MLEAFLFTAMNLAILALGAFFVILIASVIGLFVCRIGRWITGHFARSHL